MKAKFIVMLAALAVGALVVAGCGSSSSSSSDTGSSSAAAAPPATTATTPPATTSSSSGGGASGGQDLKLSADPSGQLKFDKTTLAAKAGNVTITMTNPASVPHAIAIEGKGVDKDGKTVTSGASSTVTAKLKPGTYTFYCPVPGHEQAGMKGTLTVQ
jgi:uncharacterized cupredoxin-like copper-binding protein